MKEDRLDHQVSGVRREAATLMGGQYGARVGRFHDDTWSWATCYVAILQLPDEPYSHSPHQYSDLDDRKGLLGPGAQHTQTQIFSLDG